MQNDAIDLPNKAYMLPTAIPPWPPVWWFWLVLAGLFFLIAIAITFLVIRRKRNAYRREALSSIKTSTQLSDQALVERSIELIKRCLITTGHAHLAALPIAAFLPIMEQSLKRSRYAFTEELTPLYERVYQPNIELTPADRQHLITLTAYWIRKHHA